jgi:uncharacterized protein (DUF1697 family)
MKTWIALLRGINVGGHNILPMKELRALLETEGFVDVRTYIQSGNCVFGASESDAETLADLITERIEQNFGFRPAVLVLEKPDLDRAIADNPFAEHADDPKTIHLSFLKERPTSPDLEALRALQASSEHFELTQTVFYLHAPDGIGRSKLAAQVEKKLGVQTTARNLRTVLKLAELAK